MTNNGTKTAFPAGMEGTDGLTKREYLAAMALQGLLASNAVNIWGESDKIAERAVHMADELLTALLGSNQ